MGHGVNDVAEIGRMLPLLKKLPMAFLVSEPPPQKKTKPDAGDW